MSWLDVVIATIVIVATERGYAVGILRQVGMVAGFITGFLIGVMLAPTIALHIHTNPTRPLTAALIVGVSVLIFAILGRQLGAMANLALRRLHLGTADRLGGAAFAAVGSLVACWLVASLLVNVSLASVSTAINGSRLISVMDAVMPTVPAVEARVQALFRSADFPSVFAAVVAPSVSSVPLPSLLRAEEIAGEGTTSTVKVIAVNACGSDHEGTGFVVAHNIVATAAHVVAGASHFIVAQHGARLIGFDPNNDVAFLAVNALALPSVALWKGTPSVGTPGGVVGFPQNGPRTTVPAAVAGTLRAQGRDIYDAALVTRQLVVVNASVAPGNSGSPLLVGAKVAAMIFSKSVAEPNVAYGVPVSVLRADLAAVRGATVSAGACLSS